MLKGILGVFSGDKNAHVRHLVTNIVRRVFGSIETYSRGRECALDYVNGDRHSRVTPYFLALTDFECCIGYSWQVADLLRELGGKKINIYSKGDGSGWERLHDIYTHATKHSYNKYDRTAKYEIPTTIWLTNEGINCITGASLTYRELTEVIGANNQLFYDIQKRAIEKRKELRMEAARAESK